MIIGLLTGRGGGGGTVLPDKNVHPVLGRPLMLYPYLAARQSRLLDECYLSTDGEKLKAVARRVGLKVIDRPPEFARPDSQHDACINHAVAALTDWGIPVEIIVILMCNVAIQPAGKIDACIQALLDDPSLDAAVTVREWGDHHPSRAKTPDAEGLLRPILELPEGVTTTRQLLEETFYLDHQIWALRVRGDRLPTEGLPPWSFMGRRVRGIPNQDLVIDIHTPSDVTYSELWLRAHGFQPPEPGELL